MTKITLRKVLYDVKNLLFEWRNINELVQLSFLRQKVTLIEHNEWFDQRVNNPLFDLRIIQLNNKDIGCDENLLKYNRNHYLDSKAIIFVTDKLNILFSNSNCNAVDLIFSITQSVL